MAGFFILLYFILFFFARELLANVSTEAKVYTGSNLLLRPLVTRRIVPFICGWTAQALCIFYLKPWMNLFAEGNVTIVNALITHVPIVKSVVGKEGGRARRKASFSLGVWGMPDYIQQNISNQTLMEDVTSEQRDQQIRCKLIMCPFSSNCFMKISRAFFPPPCRNSSEISGSHWSFV